MPRCPSIRILCARCHAMTELALASGPAHVTCTGCGASIPLADGGEIAGGGPVKICLRCGSDALYVRKDFPRIIGCNIVLVAAILSFWTYMLSLVAASLLELLIYWMVPSVTTCYRCTSEYRGTTPGEDHAAFDHHTRDQLEGSFDPPELAPQRAE